MGWEFAGRAGDRSSLSPSPFDVCQGESAGRVHRTGGQRSMNHRGRAPGPTGLSLGRQIRGNVVAGTKSVNQQLDRWWIGLADRLILSDLYLVGGADQRAAS